MKNKTSWLKENFFKDRDPDLIHFARIAALLGTIILALLFTLSQFFHVGIISWLLYLTTGFSLVFIVYIIAFIIALDIQVEITDYDYKNSKIYKWTKVWGIFLMALGFSLMLLTNRYQKQYSFDCITYLVDEKNECYHLKDGDCECIPDDCDLIEMKGFEARKNGYKFCVCCEEWLEMTESDALDQEHDRI